MVVACSVAMNLLLLVAMVLVRVSRAEWVEIPHLKPSSSVVSVSSITTTINPVTTPITTAGHAVVTHSQRLLSHLADEREAGGVRWSHQHSAPVRWHRPVSDLLDYDPPTKRVSHTSPWITGVSDVRNTPIALVNISNKVEELETDESEESDEQDADEQYPVVHTELLPFANRYEEESIETGTASSDGSKAMQLPVQHFDDFDDYDERLSVQQMPQTYAPDSEEVEYSGGERETDEETAEESESMEEQFKQQTQPLEMAHLRPQQPTGFGGFLEFLRRMQTSFVRRTAHTIGDKIRTLAGMRDQLLSTIERRIASLWVGNKATPVGGRRVKRGWMESQGDTDAMDFPSAEGALLTISFLTFAVFLIKLVLQVINTIKAKHYTYSTFAAATPVSGGLLVKRTRRYLEPRDIQAILGTIDGYRPV
uniref:Uncharacterized protein n=2 Tax=Anopheles stephensi TaxID=30069 RepID=A0A182Y568_ANOST